MMPRTRETWREELHRRGLWQVTAGYLAGGWALIEVVDILVGHGVLPAVVFRGALVLLALGFPVVLGTAYVQSPPGLGGATSSDSESEAGASDPGIIPRRVARFLTWRNAVLGGIGAFALLGVFTASTSLMRATGLSGDRVPDAPDPQRVVVLPFDVNGTSEVAYLAEGIVDLLSVHLDGAGPLTAVDPRVVMGSMGRDDFDPTDPEAARRFAASLGAGRFVTGNLIESSGRVRLTAYLHRTEGSAEGDEIGSRQGDARHTVAVEGAADSVFVMLDEVVARLLASIVSADGDSMPVLAASTSRSLDAVKAYLRGERELRSGRYREAAAAYQEATVLDSAFALAHYRRTIAADWVDAFDVRSSAEYARRYAEVLPPRLRSLLEGVWLHRLGRVDEAESAFEAHLHAFPNDVEALVQYGETLFHDVGRTGRSSSESIAPFRRALELEPNNGIALVHLARLYALVDSVSALERLVDRMNEVAPEGEHAAELEGLLASVTADTALADRIATNLEGTPWFFRFYPSYAVYGYGRDPWFALRLLADGPPADALDFVELKIELALGHRAAARRFFDRPDRRDDPSWTFVEAFAATTGALPVDSAKATALLRRLTAIDRQDLLRGALVPPYEDLTPRLADFERDWFRAQLLLDVGRVGEARGILEELRDREPFEALGSIKADAESSLAAFVRVAEGDRVGALALLRQMELQVPHAITIRALADQSRARFLRADLEAEFGDRETAAALYRSLDEAWSPWDNFYRPWLYERLGRLAEEGGRPDEAIAWYTRFVEMWADADSELQPARDEVAARRDALVRDRG